MWLNQEYACVNHAATNVHAFAAIDKDYLAANKKIQERHKETPVNDALWDRHNEHAIVSGTSDISEQGA